MHINPRPAAALSALLITIGLLATSVARPEQAGAIRAGASPVQLAGVSLAGAEFGDSVLPGVHGVNYIYPSAEEVDYFIGHGMNSFRLPFRWERLQRSPMGELEPEELARLDAFVAHATGRGAHVILDPHNYARYSGQVVGQGLPAEALADLWARLARRYGDNPLVIFALMNEPHDMPTALWRDVANLAIRAIRAAGASNLILVPGNAYSAAFAWGQDWYDPGHPNAVEMLKVVDPGDNYAFEVHQYLNGDSSGAEPTCVSATVGAERLAGFTAWLKANGRRGFLGEFAGGDSATCAAALDGMLAHIHANTDVWLGWAYWAAGPWWGDYPYSIAPGPGLASKPQLTTLSAYLPAAAAPPPAELSRRLYLPALFR